MSIGPWLCAQWLSAVILLPLTILFINMALSREGIALQIKSILSTDHIYAAIGTGLMRRTAIEYACAKSVCMPTPAPTPTPMSAPTCTYSSERLHKALRTYR